MKLILVGAHGTGKTTLAGMLSKELGWPVIESASRDIRALMDSGKIRISDQDYHELVTAVNVKMWKDTDKASGETNFIYTRTIIDNIAYGEDPVGLPNLHKSELYRKLMYVDGENAFRNALVVRIPIEFKLEDDGVRYTDREYQKLVSQRQSMILSALKCDEIISPDQIIEVSGTPEERYDQVLKFLKKSRYRNSSEVLK